MVTKKVLSGEITKRGDFIEVVMYRVSEEDLIRLCGAETLKLVSVGSDSSPDWYFSQENYKILKDFLNQSIYGINQD